MSESNAGAPPIRRALISVSYKVGLAAFARELSERGVEILSTGGTASMIKKAGVVVKGIADHTGFPEMMDGRLKTLHPKVHGGLLAVRGNVEHDSAAHAHGIAPIDLLVVNFYPFETTAAKGAVYDECIENIDIGGPAMIRAAAKNHASVTVVVDPADYGRVLADMGEHDGATSLALRKTLAAKAYARTAAYDAAIGGWFAKELGEQTPDWRAFAGRRVQQLRYGENPHQWAALYASGYTRPVSRRRCSTRARNSPTTTSATPMRPSSWSPSSIRKSRRRWPSSSMPIPAAWRSAPR